MTNIAIVYNGAFVDLEEKVNERLEQIYQHCKGVKIISIEFTKIETQSVVIIRYEFDKED